MMKNNISYETVPNEKIPPYTCVFFNNLDFFDNSTRRNKDTKSKYSSNIDSKIESKLEECKNKYWNYMYNTIMKEFIDEGYISDSQKLYRTIVKEFGTYVSSLFLNEFYKKYASNIKIVKSILYIFLELSPKDLCGIESAVISFSLMNKDYGIRDLALQCLEAWEDIEYLDVLKTISIDVEYLNEYLDYIIKKLESKSENKNVC